MSEQKKINIFNLIILFVVFASLILTIVGICINWITVSFTVISIGDNGLFTTSNSTYTLANTTNFNGSGAMVAFAYITLALCVLTAVVYTLNFFLENDKLKYICLSVSALLIISAIVCIALSYSFSNSLSNYIIDGNNIKATSLAAGPWLVTIFSLLGAIASILGSLKK
jgi:hypothetical protein